jgi:hypothetical protein
MARARTLTICNPRYCVPVNDTKALVEIQRLASLGRIALTDHAIRRMRERRAGLVDVRRALTSATAAMTQDRGGWRVDGGRDGDNLTVIVDMEADVIVSTPCFDGGNQ